MSTCPSDDSLRRLAGDLPPDVFAAIERHVDDCQNCMARLEALARRLELTHGASMGGGGPPTRTGLPQIPGYEIEDELGRGAMGVVYRAKRSGLDRPVALKILNAGARDEAGRAAHARWLAEARAASRVRHPNVVPLYDYGEADGWFYLVLEYIPGGTLKRRMESPLTIREAVAIVEAVARGVAEVHECGLLHLDLKPSNILMDRPPAARTPDDVPRVSDFGLARLDEDPTASASRHGGPWGTPAYMAPEQVVGVAGLGQAADVHALGAILYQALTGRLPFRGTSLLETMEHVRNSAPTSPRVLEPKVDRDIETIVLKCLEKDPRRRYSSAAAVADDLGRWLDGRPILARPVPAVGKAWRFVRRNPGLSASAAGAVLALTIGVAWIVAAKREAERGLAIATAGLTQVSDLILDELYDHHPLEGEGRATAIRNLEDKLSVLHGLRGSDPGLLSRMMQIQGQLAGRFIGQLRFDEARAAADEAVKLAGELRRNGPMIGLDYWLTASTYQVAGHVEIKAGQPSAAADYINEATSMTLTGADVTSRRWLVYPLLDDHRAIATAAILEGDETLAAHHHASREALITLLDINDSGRADRMLARATALAASGRPGESLPLAEKAISTPPPSDAQPGEPRRDVLAWLVEYRFALLGQAATYEAGMQAFRDHLGRIFDGAFAGRPSPGGAAWNVEDLAWPLLDHLVNVGAAIRREGHIDQAEELADLMSTLGDRLASSHRHSAVGPAYHGQAHIQRSKNAWRRDDLAAVRRHLEMGVEELQKAVSIEDDAWTRETLRNARTRLAALPPP